MDKGNLGGDLMAKSRMADDGIGFITIGSAICNRCTYISKDGQRCKAFPKGIPAEILGGKVSHRRAYPGDHGIQYKRRVVT